jgi:hypothetical protein
MGFKCSGFTSIGPTRPRTLTAGTHPMGLKCFVFKRIGPTRTRAKRARTRLMGLKCCGFTSIGPPMGFKSCLAFTDCKVLHVRYDGAPLVETFRRRRLCTRRGFCSPTELSSGSSSCLDSRHFSLTITHIVPQVHVMAPAMFCRIAPCTASTCNRSAVPRNAFQSGRDYT